MRRILTEYWIARTSEGQKFHITTDTSTNKCVFYTKRANSIQLSYTLIYLNRWLHFGCFERAATIRSRTRLTRKSPWVPSERYKIVFAFLSPSLFSRSNEIVCVCIWWFVPHKPFLSVQCQALSTAGTPFGSQTILSCSFPAKKNSFIFHSLLIRRTMVRVIKMISSAWWVCVCVCVPSAVVVCQSFWFGRFSYHPFWV